MTLYAVHSTLLYIKYLNYVSACACTHLKIGRVMQGADSMEPASTKELRNEIEDIDAQIIDLLATRMDISDELARAKKASGQSVWDENVEKAIITRYQELCKEVSLTKEESEQIAHLILNISKARQEKIYNE